MLTETQQEALATFQAVTGLNDSNLAQRILEEHTWDLNVSNWWTPYRVLDE